MSQNLPPPARQWLALVLVLIAAGLVLNLWRPLLLAPPYLGASGSVYLFIALAWLPVLVTLVRRGILPRRTTLALAVAGLLVTLIGVCLGPQLPGPGVVGTMNCREVARTEQRVRYDCTVDRMFLVDVYTVEGIPGWPIVWTVAHKQINL